MTAGMAYLGSAHSAHRLIRMVGSGLLLGLLAVGSVRASVEFPKAVRCANTQGFHDGDTFVCVPDGNDDKAFAVRIAGADAPETGQAHWRAARRHLRELLADGATASCYKQDQYKRQVCRVQTALGKDVSLELIEAGHAWHAVAFVHEQSAAEVRRFSEAEAFAKAQERGLWAEPDPMAPWVCRAIRKQRRRCR